MKRRIVLSLAALSATNALADATGVRTEIGMLAGQWEGDYIDVEGHRGQMAFDIEVDSGAVSGRFELVLATEDEAERTGGTLVGNTDQDGVRLRLAMPNGPAVAAVLALASPTAFALQAAFGTLAPAPAMKLGGGVIMLWRFGG